MPLWSMPIELFFIGIFVKLDVIQLILLLDLSIYS